MASAEFLPGARIVRGFNAIGFNRLRELTQAPGQNVGMPIAGDDKEAIAVASTLVKEAGLMPVLVGSLVMGRHLRPGTPLAGELTPEQIRERLKDLR